MNTDSCVLYKCSCKRWCSIAWLYFCRYCLKVRCNDCCKNEVDVRFCSYCGDRFPLKEAIDKLCRCNTCKQCPHCQSAVFDFVQTNESGEKQTLQQCSYCHWLNEERNSKITEPNWGTLHCTYNDHIQELISYYRRESSIHRLLYDDRKKLYGMMKSRLRFDDKARMKVFQPLMLKGIIPTYNKTDQSEQPIELREPAKTTSFNGVPEFVLKCTNANELCSLSQMYGSLTEKVNQTKDLQIVPRPLSARLARRCHSCERFVLKVEKLPQMKIKRVARSCVPVCKLIKLQTENNGVKFVIISIRNNVEYVQKINLSSVHDPEFSNSQIILPIDDFYILPSSEYASHAQALSNMSLDDNKLPDFVQRKNNTISLKFELIKHNDIDNQWRFTFDINYNCTKFVDITKNQNKIILPKPICDNLPMAQVSQTVRFQISEKPNIADSEVPGVCDLFKWYYHQPTMLTK